MFKSAARIALTCLALVAAGTGAAYAGGCHEYADQAVISAMQSRAWGCGYSGLRWTTSFREHYGWCRSVGYPNAFPERLARQRMLHACRG